VSAVVFDLGETLAPAEIAYVGIRWLAELPEALGV
jgi:hypothetical protein